MAPKVARPFIKQSLEASDHCNCKGFGARSRIRTDDLLFTSHSRMVVGASRAWYLAGFGAATEADTTSYRAITPGFVAPMWPGSITVLDLMALAGLDVGAGNVPCL